MLLFFILSVLLSFAATALLSKKYIPVLISKKMNQPIYEIGPRWHKSKAGTPTMGGIFFISAILITMAILSFFAIDDKEMLAPLWITLAMATLFAAVGLIDDYAKLIKKQNEGLKAYQKFLLQLVVASLYIGLMCSLGYMDTVIQIPFTEETWDLGLAFYPLAVILIVGVDNSVNLTDGIDGLCASVTAVIAAFFALLGFSVSLTLGDAVICFSGALFGGMIGFLVYNWNPARIFMGDTGSLFLGGMVTGLAFLCDNPILILIIGLLYIIETASVILQVGSYKLFKKRIFKMAPIHHHFEKCGWSERKIVFVSMAITAVLCAAVYCFSI